MRGGSNGSCSRRQPLCAVVLLASLSPALGLAADATSPELAGAAVDAAGKDGSGELLAAAEGARSAREATRLEAIGVYGIVDALPSSPKLTAPLLDTPQQITIVPERVISEQNLLNLRDILSTLPGITFGAGEGGGGYGDSINLRGFSGSNDITVDGVRDSAQYTRSDPFNLDHVELVNGANSVYAGSGSVGGSINLASKTPMLTDRSAASIGAGTDGYGRATLDSNTRIGDNAAFRVNLMAHRNDAPGREVENFRRYGLAPSIAFGLGTDSTDTVSYFHQHDDNIPQYGVPTYKGAVLPGVDRHAYYGYSDFDTQRIRADVLTNVFEHVFGSGVRLRNLSRAQRVTQYTLVDPPQGTFCLPGNLQPSGASCTLNPGTALQIVVPAGTYMPSGPRGNIRDTRNTLLYNQTDATLTFATAGIEHNLVAGASFSHEGYRLSGYNAFRNADGSNPFAAPGHLPFTPIGDPDDDYTGPVNRTLASKVRGTLDNRAFYLFDNAKFDDRWSLNFGVRGERNEASATTSIVRLFTAPTASVPNPVNTGIGQVTGTGAPADNRDSLFSYRAGLVYKPVPEASLYAAFSNSRTPSAATVNGSCVATSSTGTANCDADPEKALNYEFGAKWDLADGRLSLTGALFRNDRTNYKVPDPGNPDNPTGQVALDGAARVDGLLLGISGSLGEHWSVFANYAHLRSKVLHGASDYVADHGGDFTRGDPLLSTPEDSLSLWTTWDVTRDWQLGYGATYVGAFYVSQHSATNVDGPLNQVDGYWVQRAMVAWKVQRDLVLQLNVNNLFDEKFLTRVRTSGDIAWGTPGDSRSTTLTATYRF